MGVKKSSVWIRAVSSFKRYTPASSQVSAPTINLSSLGNVIPQSIRLRSPGPSLAAQPAALTVDVSLIMLLFCVYLIHFMPSVAVVKRKKTGQKVLYC